MINNEYKIVFNKNANCVKLILKRKYKKNKIYRTMTHMCFFNKIIEFFAIHNFL